MIITCRPRAVGPSVKVILDRTLKAKDEGGVTTYREIYVERHGLRYGPFRDPGHALKYGFVLPETMEAQ